MIHDPSEFPDQESLPDQRSRITDEEWDCLVVLDACRWDAFRDLIGSAEPVQTPAPMTPHWVASVWGEGDWSDVTYVSANPITDMINNVDGVTGELTEWVGTYIRSYEEEYGCFDEHLHTTLPHKVTNVAREQDPPVVVHYNQPHTPFIGGLSLNLCDMESLERIRNQGLLKSEESRGASIYRIAHLIDTELLRQAYLDNLRVVGDALSALHEDFEQIVFTADHGELLGPDGWGHGHHGDPRNMVVPWSRTTVDIEYNRPRP